MPSIRVKNSTVTIDVNDQGDTIVLRTDAAFLKDILATQRNFTKSYENYRRIIADDTATQEQQEAAVDGLFADNDAAIDRLFGAGACEKIFRDTGARSPFHYADFYDGLMQVVEEQQESAAGKYAKKK